MKNNKLRNFIFFLAVMSFCIFSFGVTASSLRDKSANLTLEKARILAFEALKPYDAGIGLMPFTNDSSDRFFVFEVVGAKSELAVTLGHIAVNRSTADVWDLAGSCRRISSKAIRALQRKIRKNAQVQGKNLSDDQKKPNCDAP